jgi:hypothetical protein
MDGLCNVVGIESAGSGLDAVDNGQLDEHAIWSSSETLHEPVVR